MMANKEIFNNICIKCGGTFETDKKRATVCPACKAERKRAEDKKQQELYKKPRKKPKKRIPFIPLHEYAAIIENYNKKHHTNYTYGKFTMLLNKGEIEIER